MASIGKVFLWELIQNKLKETACIGIIGNIITEIKTRGKSHIAFSFVGKVIIPDLVHIARHCFLGLTLIEFQLLKKRIFHADVLTS